MFILEDEVCGAVKHDNGTTNTKQTLFKLINKTANIKN